MQRKYIITGVRRQQLVYWTGDSWSQQSEDAKVFDEEDAAIDEMPGGHEVVGVSGIDTEVLDNA